MKIRFCPSCGRMILATFSFCPYCGSDALDGTAFGDIVSRGMDRLEAPTEKNDDEFKVPKVDRLLADLDTLDRDLGAIMNANATGASKR
ncbi:MAG: zinc-ribbon domain-containing protein [Spirochaetes bacterium]|nr:zinc-ribbon domain-containing protein [Spirochaetota bacterium]